MCQEIHVTPDGILECRKTGVQEEQLELFEGALKKACENKGGGGEKDGRKEKKGNRYGDDECKLLVLFVFMLEENYCVGPTEAT